MATRDDTEITAQEKYKAPASFLTGALRIGGFTWCRAPKGAFYQMRVAGVSGPLVLNHRRPAIASVDKKPYVLDPSKTINNAARPNA